MQEKQNKESVELKNSQVLQVTKYYFIKDFNVFKNNLPIFIILPSILGGIWQVLELSFIDPSYIRFFSINQIIPDGLLILFLSFYLFSIYNIINSLPIPKFNKEDFEDTSLIEFIIFNSIPVIAIIWGYIHIYHIEYNSFFTILLNLFLLVMIAFFILGIFIQIDLSMIKKNTRLKKIIFNFNFRKTIFILLIILFSLPVFKMLKTARELVSIPNNLNNFNKATTKFVKDNKLKTPPKLLYFNKDYLFYEIKTGNKEMIEIVETKNLFSDDSKKSKDD